MAGLVGRRDRRAALRLGTEDPVRPVLDQAQLDQLLQTLVDLGELGARGDRDHDLLRQPPAELLADLVGERLGALAVVRPQIDVDEAPALAGRVADQLRAEAVHVVVVALDADQLAAVHAGHHDLALLQVVRDEHAGPEAGPGRRRADRAGQVAGRGAGQRGVAEHPGRLDGAGHHAVLEGVGRVPGVVLDVQLPGEAELAAQVVRLHQRGPTRVEVRLGRHVGRDGQQRRVAPDRRRTGLDPLAQLLGALAAEVVGDLQRTEALETGEAGTEREPGAALATGQRGGGAEVNGGGDGCGGVDSHDGRRPLSSSSP